jgi:hypothetical protein
MTKRLQVLFDDAEMRDIQRAARRRRLTVAEWVRQATRKARDDDARSDPAQKLAALHQATRHAFPTGDIDRLLADVERGYLAEREA